MTPFPDCPTAKQAERASDMLLKVRHWLDEIDGSADALDQRAWDRATGHLQDALAELGFDLRPLRTQPPATADALFDAAAYDRSRGM